MSKHSVKRRGGRSSILFIALLLIASGSIRLSLSAGFALAEVQKEPEIENSFKPDTPDPVRMKILLEALLEREARVKEKEEQIEARHKKLMIADTEVKKRLTALEQAEDSLRKTLALADGAAENDIARLTSVYESMKPKDAAALFETMEHSFAAGFIGRMRPEAAAAVMAGLSAETAYAISVILAGRHANVPKT